jgi:hypothetical protein
VVVIENYTAVNLTAHGAGGAASTLALPARTDGGEPGRIVSQLWPGTYQIELEGPGFSAYGAFTTRPGELWHLTADIHIHGGPNSNPTAEVDTSLLAIPPGCPGAAPIAPAGPAVCPAWYASPEPSKGFYLIENFVPGGGLNIVGVKGTAGEYRVAGRVTVAPER